MSVPNGLPNFPEFEGLRGAAYLVALRQELFIAFVTQRPVLPAFTFCSADRSLDGPLDDCSWTNRVMLFAIDVLEFCYAEHAISHGQLLNRYTQLLAWADQWFQLKSARFEPIFVADFALASLTSAGLDLRHGLQTWPVSSSIHPSIWLLNDAVATGLQNYYLTRILLLAFDPHTPRTGPTRTAFLQKQDEEVRTHTRTMIGIAKGNPQCIPLSVWASVGIAMAGDRFETREEQGELIQFLRYAETLSIWRTKPSQVHLAEAWKWDEQTMKDFGL